MSALAAALEIAGVECRGCVIFRIQPETKRSHQSLRYSGGRHWGMSSDPMEIERDFRRWPGANAVMDCFQPEPVDG
jgi:hypothetical protein